VTRTIPSGESRSLYGTAIRREVIVVGGGQAGLAIGYLLAQKEPEGDRPVQAATRLGRQIVGARIGRARRALFGRRAIKRPAAEQVQK
jgi:glycine/D-amino acid oxidase-like deaminating enzyme